MRIVTDAAADLTPEESAAKGIIRAPLYINFPDGTISADDIQPDEFYEKMADIFPVLPTTAQPSAGQMAELYRGIANQDRDILSIHISSGLSGTINAARLGAEQVKADATVEVYDSMTLSGGQRFQVLAAAAGVAAGRPLTAILEQMAKIRDQVEVIYTLETLEYLAKGGRIGRVSALAGSLLKIKPVIRVDHADGKYSTVDRARTIPQALQSITTHLSKLYGSTEVWATVLHGQLAEPAQALADHLKNTLSVKRLEVKRISPILGVHTGPGIVGTAIVPMDLMQDVA
jgi:DegV family protein with EDD domain